MAEEIKKIITGAARAEEGAGGGKHAWLSDLSDKCLCTSGTLLGYCSSHLAMWLEAYGSTSRCVHTLYMYV